MRPIDADELKKAIELLCEDERTNMTAIAYFALRELIDTMPTIEAEPVKHGRWMYPFYCSVCGFAPYYSSDLTYNYCPNCGSKQDL